jgi:hypothetical protein
MNNRLLLLLFLAMAPAWSSARHVSPTASASSTTLTASLSARAWMDGGRLLVSGAAVGLGSEGAAKLMAVKDAAASAAEFLDKKGISQPALVRRGIEDSLLRETPLAGEDYGDVRIEDDCREHWTDENGLDRWSMTLTLSLRVGKGTGH